MPGFPFFTQANTRTHPDVPLPPARLGGLTGWNCSVCPPDLTTPTVYKKEQEDSYLVVCQGPTKHWKTWACAQLNYEIRQVNAKFKPPITYDKLAHGPRISPRGAILPEKPSKPSKSAKANSSKSPTIDCVRHATKDRAQGHRQVSNGLCPNVMCLRCCVEYGTTSCFHKRGRDLPPVTPSSPPASLILKAPTQTRQQQFPPMDSTSTTSTYNRPVHPTPQLGRQKSSAASKTMPIDSATVSKSLGRQLSNYGHISVDSSLRRRGGDGLDPIPCSSQVTVSKSHEVRRDLKTDTEMLKRMITIISWFKSGPPTARTALAVNWPMMAMDEVMGVAEDAGAQYTGGKWNGVLVIYDSELTLWRDLPIGYPHLYPIDNRKILVRIKKVEPEECEGLAGMIAAMAIAHSKPSEPSQSLAPLPSPAVRVKSEEPSSSAVRENDYVTIDLCSPSPELAAREVIGNPIDPERWVLEDEGDFLPDDPFDRQATSVPPTQGELSTIPPSSQIPMGAHGVVGVSPGKYSISVIVGRSARTLSPFGQLPHGSSGSEAPNSQAPQSTDTPAMAPLDDTDSENEPGSAVGGAHKWPALSAPVEQLLTWVDRAENGGRIAIWHELWGDEFNFKSATVYRYYNWVEKLERTGRLSSWMVEQVRPPTIKDARSMFPIEFKKSCNLKRKTRDP